MDTSKLAELYTYSDRSLVYFNEFATSDNGKFAVAAIMSRGLVKIDLETGEMTVLSSRTYGNGVGLFMSISNDGRYVASTMAGSGKLYIFDSAHCSQKYTLGNWPRYAAFTGSGCIERDIYPALRTLHPNITNSSGVHFLNNPALLELFMYYTGDSGQTASRRIRLTSEGGNAVNGYLALGDSFSSGEGDLEGGVWYEQGTDEQGNNATFEGRNLCHLSRRSYPYLLAVQLGYLTTNSQSPPSGGSFHSVACSGAVVGNLIGQGNDKITTSPTSEDEFKISDNQYDYYFKDSLSSWQPGHVKQLDFLLSDNGAGYGDNTKKPEIITLGIGGNDAGFGDVIAACVSPGVCAQAEPASQAAYNQAVAMAGLKPKLTQVYRRVMSASPSSRLYVHGYPNFVQEGGECALNVRFHAKELTMISEGIQYMNRIVRAAADEAGAFYVDVETILDGADLCSNSSDDQMSFNGVTAGNDINNSLTYILSAGVCIPRTGCIGKESYHPNHKGHYKYAERLLEKTQNFLAPMPVASPTDIPLPNKAYYGESAWDRVNYMNIGTSSVSLPLIEHGSFLSKSPSGLLSVEQVGLLPFSQLRIEVRSTPQTLAEIVVSADGVVSETISLPDDLEAGVHEVHLLGFSAVGEPIDIFETIVVGFSDTDFDGDKVEDSRDSCPIVENTGIDVDMDGVDDACDQSPVARELSEVDEDNPDEVENADNKGVVSPETEAGYEQLVAQTTGVLGASTTLAENSSSSQKLSSTGQPAAAKLLFGALLVMANIVLFAIARKHDQVKYRTGKR